MHEARIEIWEHLVVSFCSDQKEPLSHAHSGVTAHLSQCRYLMQIPGSRQAAGLPR
jgi:hypothetical protein